MSSFLLDAGALVAVERGDRDVLVRLKEAVRGELELRTNGAVLAEVWRGGAGRQAPLAVLLHSVEVAPVDETLGRAAGVLLGESQAGDAVDATLVALADSGDRIFTSDPDDIRALVLAGRRRVFVLPC